MKLAVVIECLYIGGAQQVVCTQANAWAAMGYEVTIFTFDPPGATDTFELADAVNVVRLNLNYPAENRLGAIRRFGHSISILRRKLMAYAPDVVVSHQGQTNVLCLLACMATKLPVVVVEHAYPDFAPIGRGWMQLRRLLYGRAAKVLVLTKAMQVRFAEMGIKESVVVPNPVQSVSPATESVKKPKPLAVGAGRLVQQKNFSDLIGAFALIAHKVPDWNIEIYGEGDDRAMLEQKIKDAALEGRVSLVGWVDDLDTRLREADIFVLPSLFEGFPMVLCEAMASGLPAVAYDCPSGPADIVRDGVDGHLIPLGNVEEMAAALHRLMQDGAIRHSMSEKAKEVSERFSVEKVMGMWDALLKESMGREAAS